MSVDLLIRLSVRLPITRRYSVETAKHIIKLFEPSRHIILFSLYQTLWHWYIPTGTPLTGASPSNTRGVKNISLYLRNDTRYGHSCYGMRIGNFTEAFEWCHFQWPWMTCKPDFKIAPLFDAEYLRNGTRCRHSFNRILIWLTHAGHALYTQGCHFNLEWLSEIFSDTKRRTVSLRQLNFLYHQPVFRS